MVPDSATIIRTRVGQRLLSQTDRIRRRSGTLPACVCDDVACPRLHPLEIARHVYCSCPNLEAAYSNVAQSKQSQATRRPPRHIGTSLPFVMKKALLTSS